MKNDQAVVFVTGGSRGIGKAIVEKFKSQGWAVAACSANAKESSADLHLMCDVSDATSVRKAIDATIKKFGRLDAVINNAGIANSNSLHPDDSDDAWHQ